jgi:hypothetical protein
VAIQVTEAVMAQRVALAAAVVVATMARMAVPEERLAVALRLVLTVILAQKAIIAA